MGAPPLDEHDILMVIKTRTVVGFDEIAEATGAERVGLSVALSEWTSAGLLRYFDGVVSGWSLTTPGRQRLVSLIRSEGLSLEYARLMIDHFDPINRSFLHALRADQDSLGSDLEETVTYIGHLVDELEPVLGGSTAAHQRLTQYVDAMRAALAAVGNGNTANLVGARSTSVHSLWFALHEHLLVAAERARNE